MNKCCGVAIVVIGLALVPAPAAAHGTAPRSRAGSPPRLSAAARQVIGQGVQRLSNGLYRVPIRNARDLTTHGPDPAPHVAAPDAAYPDDPFGAGAPERSPHCATDRYQHVLYAHFTDGPDNYSTAKPEIQAIIERIDSLLDQESQASGGPHADYKVLCDSGGDTRVDSLAVPTSYDEAPSYQSIVNAAVAAGFDDGRADYTIFVDSDPFWPNFIGACGLGSLRPDETPSSHNLNDNSSGAGSGYAEIFGGCWTNNTPMHEVGHTEGAVQNGAPYATGIDAFGAGGHCWDADLTYDVMCYSPDGGPNHQEGTEANCTDLLHFDCGHDTYFDSAPEPGEWLASHWNLGSCANQFMDFGCPPDTTAPQTTITQGPPARTLLPVATFAFTSSEAGSTFECRLDSASFSPCTAPKDVGVRIGSHIFAVRAIDEAGNADSTPATRTWVVDKKKKKKRHKKKGKKK